VGIAAPVTINLPANLTITSVLTVSHPDGRYITITGPDGGTTVTSTTAEAFRILNGGALLRRLSIVAGSQNARIAVNVGFATPATMQDVTVVGFNGDAVIVSGGQLVLNRVSLTNNIRALSVQSGGRVRHQGALTISATTGEGIRVSDGGHIDLFNASITTTSGLALAITDNGSVAAASSALNGGVNLRAGTLSINGGNYGRLVLTDNSAAIIADSSTSEGPTVTRGSTLRLSGAPATAVACRENATVSVLDGNTCTSTDTTCVCVGP